MGSYSIQARRFVKQQVDTLPSPCFATEAQASSTFEALKLNATWRLTQRGTLAVLPTTGSENTAGNMAKLDHLDAFAFCADHADGQHILRMGLVAYRVTLPDAFIGATMQSIQLSLHGDPHLRDGAIVGIAPSISDQPASDWVAAIQNAPGKIIQGVVRTEVPNPTPSLPNGVLWYARSKVYTLSATGAFDDGAQGIFPPAGMPLQKHLFIYVAMANYQRVRNMWVEGSAMMNSGIAFSATGYGLPPDGALPDGSEEAFVVEQISDTSFLSFPSRISYPDADIDETVVERIFGQGASIGITAYHPDNNCESENRDILNHIQMLKTNPKGYMDLVFATNSLSQSGKTTCLFAGMYLALHSISSPDISQTVYNLIRKYQRTFVRLQSRSTMYRLEWDRPTAGGIVTVQESYASIATGTNAKMSVTLWFLPSSVLQNEHPDRYIFRNGTHKKPQFWSGSVETLDGMMRLNNPTRIPNTSDYSQGCGFNVPVNIPFVLDGQQGILFMTPDIDVMDLTVFVQNRINQPSISNIDEPGFSMIPLSDDKGFATQAMFNVETTRWLRTFFVRVFNGATGGVTIQ